jgi:hypothetical protein
MPPVGFEPAIPTSERPQTRALDRAATGIGHSPLLVFVIPEAIWVAFLHFVSDKNLNFVCYVFHNFHEILRAKFVTDI